MKILQKCLALLLAGLMASAMLLSCSDDAFTIDDDEREHAEQVSKEFYRTKKVTTPAKKPDQNGQTAPTTTSDAVVTDSPAVEDAPITAMLTPEQLYRALETRRDSHIEMVYRDADGEYETITLSKDGDQLEIVMGYESGARSVVSYYDFVHSIEYYEDADGWQVMPINPVGMTWSSLLASLNETLSMVFDAKSDAFALSDDPNVLEMKKDALEAYGYGYLSYAYDPAEQTHSFLIRDEALEKSVDISVDLTHPVTVLLPEVSGADGGSNDPSLYTNMTPSALYTALTEAEDVSITVSGEDIYTFYEKDGGRAYLYAGTDENDGTAIYTDFPSGLTFAQLDDGSWTANYLDEPITWRALLDELLLTDAAYFFRDLNYGEFDEDDRILSVSYRLLEGSGVDAATLERDGLTYRLTETYTTGKTVVTVFRFDSVTVIFPSVSADGR